MIKNLKIGTGCIVNIECQRSNIQIITLEPHAEIIKTNNSFTNTSPDITYILVQDIIGSHELIGYTPYHPTEV